MIIVVNMFFRRGNIKFPQLCVVGMVKKQSVRTLKQTKLISSHVFPARPFPAN